MDITDRLIQEIQNAVDTKIITTLIGECSTRPLYPVKAPADPEPAPILLHTLTGITRLLKESLKFGAPSVRNNIVHILSPCEVVVVSELYGPNKQRDHFCTAKFEALFGKSFGFGSYFDHESFLISLATLFQPTPARDELISIVGTIKNEEVQQATDDGISQQVTAKAGAVLVRPVTLPNPVILKPYRTFRELDQPESPFLLRAKRVSGALPQLALFECDGGLWKLEAMSGIVEFITKQTDGTAGFTIIV